MKAAAFFLGIGLALPAPAFARDWFDFDRAEAVRRIGAAVEQLEAVAPIPPLHCRAAYYSTRHCEADLLRGLKLQIVTTLYDSARSRSDEEFQRFSADENAGNVYEMTIRLEGTRYRGLDAAEGFDVVCKALILTGMPQIGVAGAGRRYNSSLRRALNRSMTDNSREIVPGNPGTLVIEANTNGWATCTMTASRVHRP